MNKVAIKSIDEAFNKGKFIYLTKKDIADAGFYYLLKKET